MSAINDGGSAFPRIEPFNGVDGPVIYFGMTLRDYFAAKAMEGMIGGIWVSSSDDRRHISEFSYDMADAMLQARQS